jgi:hypothetical protein
MKSLLVVPYAVHSPHPARIAPVPLHKLIDRLLTGLLPLVTGKKSFIINDVDRAFSLQADENVLAFVVGNLLSGAVNSTVNGCIRVEAVLDEKGVQIKVRNNGIYLYNTAANQFSQVVKAARQLGGSISIHNQKNEGTTVVFSVAGYKTAC